MARPSPFTVMYHGVLPDHPPVPWASLGVIGQSEFERQLRLLKRAFHVLHPHELLDGLRRRRPCARGSALVTLDDGFQNVLEYALPVAESLGVPLLVFVCDGPMDGGEWLWFCRMLAVHLRQGRPLDAMIEEYSPLPLEEVETRLAALPAPCRSEGSGLERRFFDGMDTAGLSKAVARGSIVPGGHTTHHPNLVAEADDVIRREVRGNKERLESAIGGPIGFFAYPGGHADQRVAAAVRACGYDGAFVVSPPREPIPEGLQDFFLPRTGIYRPGMLRFLAKGILARLRA